MMYAAMLAGTSALMLVWRPCRSREGRMPRSAVAMLLLSAVGLWTGSLALVVHLLADPGAGLVAAGVYVFAPGVFAAALPALILAICPLSMVAMMLLMRGLPPSKG